MPASKTHLHLVIRLLNISLNSFILYLCNEKECSRKTFKWNKNRNPYTNTYQDGYMSIYKLIQIMAHLDICCH